MEDKKIKEFSCKRCGKRFEREIYYKSHVKKCGGELIHRVNDSREISRRIVFPEMSSNGKAKL
jgi:predicted RNA-binding Zn-ribbon protein involved in translation (DUF1610 family)